MILTPELYREILTVVLLGVGLVFVVAGFFKLLGFGYQSHARALAAQSAKLGQKSITADITNIVQAAVQLNESVNNMLRTSAGVGMIMIFVGALSLYSSYMVMIVL